jgi:stage III sporulation protein AG
MAAEPGKMEQEKKSLFQRLAENDTYRKIIVGAGLLGIFLIVISGSFKGCSAQTPSSSSASSQQKTTLTADEYTRQLENSLSNIISQIDGVGNVHIMITLEQTAESVYAKDQKTSDEGTSETDENGTGRQETNKSNETTYLVIKDENGSERVLELTEIQPLIRGVVVVCDGGGDARVQKEVTDAVTTALHITSVRVCVIKAK